jgi:phosphoribosyl 1,2-cyclic phosphodiesterase
LSPAGKKNIRRNTSCAIRIDGKDGEKKTIVIDVGKNFQASSIEWFPKFGLRHIDAVLITHAHADAMNGLDDLRAWTLGKSSIQKHIDIYVSQATFKDVQRSFPYLVAKEYASGGGDVPEFKWHIINDQVPFEIENTGIEVTPFTVQHGRLFSTDPPHAYISTPDNTLPSTPIVSGASSPARVVHPYLWFGFKIQDTIVYISDVSYIPEEAWTVLEAPRTDRRALPVFVLDCLGLTGFGHEVTHDDYVTIGEVAGGKSYADTAKLTAIEQRGISLIEEGVSVWLRPAHDGLRVFVDGDGNVKDESYD